MDWSFICSNFKSVKFVFNATRQVLTKPDYKVQQLCLCSSNSFIPQELTLASTIKINILKDDKTALCRFVGAFQLISTAPFDQRAKIRC